MTTATPTGHLIYLLTDLSRDPALRDRLANQPDEVIGAYRLAPEVLTALRSRNDAQIAGELVRDGLDLLAELRRHRAMMANLWFSPDIQVNSVSPSSGAINQSIPVTVEGVGFPSQQYAVLEFTAPNVETVTANVTSVTIDPRTGASKMAATVTFATAAVYTTVVTDSTSNSSGQLASAFTAYDPTVR